MIESIRSIVDKAVANYSASLPIGYESVVADVVEALEQRDDAIVEYLRTQATNQYLETTPVTEALLGAGLIRPVPHVMPSYVTSVPPGVQASIDQIDAQLAEVKRVLGI